MNVQQYPQFHELNFEMKDELTQALWKKNNGISELTFANLYLFRDTYKYMVTKIDDDRYIYSGRKGNESQGAVFKRGCPDGPGFCNTTQERPVQPILYSCY